MLFISDRIRRPNVNWILGSSRTINSALFLVPDNPESRQVWRDPDIGSDRNGWSPITKRMHRNWYECMLIPNELLQVKDLSDPLEV
ncbi:unnamed protein product, partial [Rotaria magnacalcarata]